MTTADAGTAGHVLFISHNAADRPFALALQSAIRELIDSDTLIDVRYSTSDEAGPQGGDEWREWIYRQVVEARTALIVVTPHALGKPWLLWEAGACWGAALAQRAARESVAGASANDPADPLGGRLNVSIAYGLAETDCPDPLRGDQIIQGANPERIRQLLQRILQTHDIPSRQLIKAGERMQGVLERYLPKVRDAMLQAPSLVNEANVQDWLSRLDMLARSDRLSELGGFQRWMTLAFGRDADAGGVPIDVRLHRRLGELYLGQRQYAQAVEQLTLARWAAPRDIYVLRPLAEAAMKRLLAERGDAGDAASSRQQIESLLAAIAELDDKAFVANPDAAALYGKYLRRVAGDRQAAVRVYDAALQANADSYYLADLLAQTRLELGVKDEALATYRQALAIIERIGEHNEWSHATAATAHLALGDLGGARQRLTAIAAMEPAPSASTIEAVSQGLRDVGSRVGMPAEALDDLLGVLRQAT
ncbi:MAG TPA: TIR domain-containing protein [Albitalea sp.]